MITDDDLLLYYYRDGLDAAERARIGAALSEQPELAQRLQSLVARLDAAAAIPDVPVPAQVQQRWRDALERAALQEGKSIASVPRPVRRFDFRWAAAAAVAVVALVFYRNQPHDVTVMDPTNVVAGDASAYQRGLKVHLASTERQLADIGNATPEERAKLIETIVAQNRIYALAAERAGEPQLARVLRAFSPVLESLKQEGADPTASVAQLAFEFRVMQGRLATGPASTPNSTTL
jgi:hypothetical protein